MDQEVKDAKGYPPHAPGNIQVGVSLLDHLLEMAPAIYETNARNHPRKMCIGLRSGRRKVIKPDTDDLLLELPRLRIRIGDRCQLHLPPLAPCWNPV